MPAVMISLPRAGTRAHVTLVVNIEHWLDEHGELPVENLRLRRNALRIVHLIEYGGPVVPLHARETLIECRRRPGRKQCLGLLWVTKLNDNRIQAHCQICGHVEAVISGWEDTLWADGPMEPMPMTDD
jgi:hypothetical protein